MGKRLTYLVTGIIIGAGLMSDTGKYYVNKAFNYCAGEARVYLSDPKTWDTATDLVQKGKRYYVVVDAKYIRNNNKINRGRR